MSYDNKRFVVAYCLLVVLPVLGFIEVLNKGHGMSAPISIEGTWKLETNAVELAALLCGKVPSAIQESFITISQSGKYLVLELNSGSVAHGLGVIEGNVIKASVLPLPEGSNEMTCVSRRMLALNITVDARAVPASLVGKLSVESCPTCTTADFWAARQTHQLNKGAH